MGDLGQALIDGLEFVEPDCIPELSVAVDLDVGEVRVRGRQFTQTVEDGGNAAVARVTEQQTRELLARISDFAVVPYG